MATGFNVTLLTQATEDAATDQAREIANKFAVFVGSAKSTLDIAIYDFRLTGDPAEIVLNALNGAAQSGVVVRLAYFVPKQHRTTAAQFAVHGHDPAPPPSLAFLKKMDPSIRQKGIVEEIDTQSGITGKFDQTIQVEGIDGSGHLMHSKYMIRDANGTTPSLWMGSANFTVDAWCRQDNNIVIVDSPDLANAYATDFGELWERERIGTTGRNDTVTVNVNGVETTASFAPGDGTRIDSMIADLINGATTSVAVASMVISSAQIMAALGGAMNRGLTVSGVYDGPEMHQVVGAWNRSGKSADKLAMWEKIEPALVGKRSTPFSEGGVHDFMHNKLVSVDNRAVVTGSFNFSTNATHNAENVLWIEDEGLARQYAEYVASLVKKYGHPSDAAGKEHKPARRTHP